MAVTPSALEDFDQGLEIKWGLEVALTVWPARSLFVDIYLPNPRWYEEIILQSLRLPDELQPVTTILAVIMG